MIADSGSGGTREDERNYYEGRKGKRKWRKEVRNENEKNEKMRAME
jgi:hypothetical protein